MKKGKTNRGFSLITFKDIYGASCSLQKSSLATEDAIWLGCDEVSYDGKVPFNTRMHLDTKLAKKLIKKLTKFVKTGEV